MADSIVAAPARRGLGWYYGWNIVALSVLSQMMSLGLGTNCFTLFTDNWSHEFHAPISSVSLAFMIFAYACAPLCIVAGWAASRFSVRWVLAIGLVIVGVVQAAVGFTTAVWQLIALYTILPIGVTISSSIPAQTLVARWFVQRRGLALGISAFGLASASVIFPPIVTAMAASLGWRMTWWVFSAVIIFVIAPLVLLFVRDQPDPESQASPYMRGAPEATTDAPVMTYLQILSRPNFWVIGLVFLCVFSVFQALLINLKPLVLSHGLSPWTAGILLSAFAVTDLIGKVVSGAAADRFGNRLPLIALCLIAAAAAVVLAFAHNTPILIGGLLAMGVAGAIWTLLASATAAEFGHQNFGRAFGPVSVFSTAAGMSPFMLALSQEKTGSYTIGLLGLAAIALLGAVIALMLKERKIVRQADIPPHATPASEIV